MVAQTGQPSGWPVSL
ncbi:ash family protein [Rahnella sp. LAC-M12]|uniref:Ash family protein n=1 Tax=Rahnella laticis TaxID=2787622 RepID=A0ABS0E0F0_9GAMM|nr:ash family protein [Rahnella laticis]MBF7998658.1 ash family protein [Rahnella sp. LAC-M12]